MMKSKTRNEGDDEEGWVSFHTYPSAPDLRILFKTHARTHTQETRRRLVLNPKQLENLDQARSVFRACPP